MKIFDTPEKTIGDMKADLAARLIAATSDIAVVIDRAGTIKDFATSTDMPEETYSNWIGKSWLDVVTPECRKKAKDLLSPPAANDVARWRQVNHPVGGQPDIPVRYTSIPLGSNGKVLALGNDLRPMAVQQQRILEAQSAMEREYERLRQSETRYRALFQVSSEAVLIVDSRSQKVVEANPAATQLLVNGAKAVAGRPFADLFSEDSTPIAIDSLSAAQSMPRVDGVIVVSAHGHRQLVMTTSLIRQSRTTYYLVRLNTRGSEANATGLVERSNIFKAIDQLPDGLVLVDKDRRIMMGNPAFLELCELAQETQVKGEPVDRWLGRVSVDIDVLLAHVREHGTTRRFATIVRGEYGSRAEVDISAVLVDSGEEPYYAFSLRRLEPAAASESRAERQLPQSVEQLTKLVGRVPLKELVGETTDIVEKLCIEASLDLTRGNRASAAEMLGLSRQSFYVKLRRYGIGDRDSEEHDLD